MKHESDNLEHLISRHLDGECTRAERQLLQELLREDSEARRLYDEYEALDREVGAALRQAVGRSPRIIPLRGRWRLAGRWALMAAAAGVALLLWWSPRPAEHRSPDGRRVERAGIGPALPLGASPAFDVVEPVPRFFERPQLGVRGIERDWIVIPTDQRNTVVIIQVDRTRTRAVTVQQDF